MARVWIIGSGNVDRPWTVDRHPEVGETVLGQRGEARPGGKGLNQAVAAARAGAPVELVACVGDDPDGRWLVEVAAEEGIGTDHVTVDPHRPTGTALIVVDRAGANTVTVAPGANAALEVGELPVAAGDVVVAQFEVPRAAIAQAFDRAAAVGARTLLNPSPLPDGPLDDAGADLVARADVVVVNEHEAAALGEVAATRALPAHQVRVVTLGARGLVAHLPDRQLQVAGVAVAPVDSTGAGDCFLGVLAQGLAAGAPLAEALDRANRAAARSVTRAGTVPAMPRADELDHT